MMLLRRLAFAVYLSAFACLAQEAELADEPLVESSRANMWDFLTQAEEYGLDLVTTPDTHWNVEEGELDTLITLDGGANIKHQGVDLYADSYKISVATQDVHLSGNVRIYRDELVFKGHSAIYNYGDGRVTANNLRSGQDPVLFSAGSFRSKFDLEAKTANFFEADTTLVTTHDLEKPNYRIEAGRVKILPPPDNRIEMHDVKIFIGDRQVFWFPYLAKSVDEELGWYFRPGFDSNWGAYLLSEYGFRWEDHTLVKVQADVRSRRGLAGGVELHSQKFKDNDNIGRFKAYYANDLNPDISRTTMSRRDVNEDRYRFSLQHRVYVPGPEDSDLYVDIDVNLLSDEFVYEDFFPSELKTDPNPENMINIVKTDPRGTLSTMARFNGNDFFRSDERLPEVALDITRQSVFGSDLFYEGSTSIGAYREPLSSREREFLRGDGGSLEEFFGVPESAIDPSELNSLLNDLEAQVDGYSFKRFDTFHQLSLPVVNERGFSLVPRVGARYTNYFDIDSGDPDIDSSESRALLHAGIEGAFKFSREYPDVRSDRWGLNELRHIVQPYFNYSFLAGNDLSGDVPRIDRLTPSTQLRPIDISKYTATDDLSPWNVLRLGVRNVLQTKRDGQTHNWLQLNTYLDTFLEDPEASRTYSNLFNELVWHPLPWLKLEMDSQLPIFADEQDFVEVNSRLRYMPTKNMEFILSHRFLSDHPFFGDSNLLNFRFYTKINENWGFGTYHRYELDDNTLELQQYSIHRDLGSWTAAFGGLARDNRGEREYGVVFALSLNDLPRVRLPLSIDPNPSGR
ncbi:MAG: hypothetical protein GWQ08_07275 [Verrucomicrobiaceae bacterium]|nr:hypothetical protein [Verrucomicrobiaceae bacterium]